MRKKPTTVTRQLTKSRDFRQNCLCEFHLWCIGEDPHQRGSASAREIQAVDELKLRPNKITVPVCGYVVFL
jgi:hypothetical protein